MNKPLLLASAATIAAGFASYSLFDVLAAQAGASAPTALMPLGALLLLAGGAGAVLSVLFDMFQRTDSAF